MSELSSAEMAMNFNVPSDLMDGQWNPAGVFLGRFGLGWAGEYYHVIYTTEPIAHLTYALNGYPVGSPIWPMLFINLRTEKLILLFTYEYSWEWELIFGNSLNPAYVMFQYYGGANSEYQTSHYPLFHMYAAAIDFIRAKKRFKVRNSLLNSYPFLFKILPDQVRQDNDYTYFPTKTTISYVANTNFENDIRDYPPPAPYDVMSDTELQTALGQLAVMAGISLLEPTPAGEVVTTIKAGTLAGRFLWSRFQSALFTGAVGIYLTDIFGRSNQAEVVSPETWAEMESVLDGVVDTALEVVEGTYGKFIRANALIKVHNTEQSAYLDDVLREEMITTRAAVAQFGVYNLEGKLLHTFEDYIKHDHFLDQNDWTYGDPTAHDTRQVFSGQDYFRGVDDFSLALLLHDTEYSVGYFGKAEWSIIPIALTSFDHPFTDVGYDF